MKENKEIFDLVSYTIKTKKLKADERKSVILIADLHNFTNNKKKSNQLASFIKQRNPHHIVITGDIIQGSKWENEKYIAMLSEFLFDISKSAPVFLVLGNHDLVGYNEKRLDIFKKLSNIRRGKIYPLVNDVITYDNFDIVGFTPNKNAFNIEYQQHGLSHDLFIKEYINNGIRINKSNNIVEFIGHSPYLFAASENCVGLECLEHVDAFLTGHMHNGYKRSSTIKKNPDKYLDNGYVERSYSLNKNGNLCSINPLFFSKTPLCRGIIYVDGDAQRKILQLRNNHYYINKSVDDNDQSWMQIGESRALRTITRKKYHAVVIAGGIRKFFGLNLPGDIPEVTEVIYENKTV